MAGSIAETTWDCAACFVGKLCSEVRVVQSRVLGDLWRHRGIGDAATLSTRLGKGKMADAGAKCEVGERNLEERRGGWGGMARTMARRERVKREEGRASCAGIETQLGRPLLFPSRFSSAPLSYM